jgi:hypothetical protein
MRRSAAKDPKHASGVQGRSPLSLLPLFNMVLDIMMCLMHIIPVLWKGHLMPLLKGKRTPGPFKPTASRNDEENAAVSRARHTVCAAQSEWALSASDPRALLLDTRSLSLAGKPRWIRARTKAPALTLLAVFIHDQHICTYLYVFHRCTQIPVP